jgi:hypothetical protein
MYTKFIIFIVFTCVQFIVFSKPLILIAQCVLYCIVVLLYQTIVEMLCVCVFTVTEVCLDCISNLRVLCQQHETFSTS